MVKQITIEQPKSTQALEIKKRAIIFTALSLSIAFFSTFARQRTEAKGVVKNLIREKQNHICPYCGQSDPKLDIHHGVPKRWKGRNGRGNLAGLDKQCHHLWDEKTAKTGIVYPGIDIAETPEKWFKTPEDKIEAVRKFYT